MTQKEAVLAMMQGEKVTELVKGWEPFQLVFDDMLFHTSPARPNTTVVDAWGVTMVWEADQPGVMPSEEPELLACPDLAEWESYLKVPDVDSWELDWSGAFGQKAAAHEAGKFAMGFMPCGVFELFHNILGFEEALIGLLTEPEAAKSLIDTIFDYKMKCLKRITEAWQPDGILMHDDWGSKDSLLMPPATWREYFKEGYRKLIEYAHAHDMFVMIHSDSNNELIAADMEEIGVDIWQGALPQCDLVRLQKELPGKMLFMGGLDMGLIDHKGIDPAVVKQEVERACTEYLPGGRFIPCITYGGPGSICPETDVLIAEALESLSN